MQTRLDNHLNHYLEVSIMKFLTSALITCAFILPSSAFADNYHREFQSHSARHPNSLVYSYVYYPSHQVYYSNFDRNWYWINHGRWEVTSVLPEALVVSLRYGGIQVSLNNRHPYYEHFIVDQNYGAPWRERHYRERYERYDEYSNRERQFVRPMHREHHWHHEH